MYEEREFLVTLLKDNMMRQGLRCPTRMRISLFKVSYNKVTLTINVIPVLNPISSFLKERFAIYPTPNFFLTTVDNLFVISIVLQSVTPSQVFVKRLEQNNLTEPHDDKIL